MAFIQQRMVRNDYSVLYMRDLLSANVTVTGGHCQPQASKSDTGPSESADKLSCTSHPYIGNGMYPLLDLISEHGASGLGTVNVSSRPLYLR